MKRCPNCGEPKGDINSSFFIADGVYCCLNCGKDFQPDGTEVIYSKEVIRNDESSE